MLMEERSLPVVIVALIHQNRILLIKRSSGDYSGLWGLPGGKIEKDEHLSEAAIREIKEECGIDSEFKKYLGIISEHLIENNNITKHFLLHVCELIPNEIRENEETKWFELSEIDKIKEQLIPSDFYIIKKWF
jgi:8-oxo-dGTP diphosphatase